MSDEQQAVIDSIAAEFGNDRGRLMAIVQAVQDRHANVHQHHVRAQVLSLEAGIAAVGRLAHHLDVRLVAEQQPDTFPQDGVIVGDEHANAGMNSHGHQAATFSEHGTRTARRVPWPRRESTCRVPPKRLTRS